MTDFHGVFPYLVSPVDADGQIRTEVLGRLCDDLIKSGVHGLTPLGSTGEFAYLNNIQRFAVVQTTIEAAAGRVPVVAGVASTSTADAVAQAKAYQKLGANGILAILEAYFPLGDAPGRILFSRHCRCGRYSRGDLHQSAIPALGPDARCHRTARGASAHRLHQGRLDQYRAAAVDHEPLRRQHQSVLGVGAYPGGGDADRRGRLDGRTGLHHSAPKRRALQSLQGRALGRGAGLQRRLWRINEAFARYNLAACIKAGLAIQGYEVGDPVAPQAALTADERKAVEAVLREVG